MARVHTRRQSIRRALLIASFVLFPVTLNYFSPYLVVESAASGVVNGSLLVFGSMFAGSLVLGRLWCGWACPAAGLQESVLPVNRRRVSRRADYVKWAIWVPWVAAIALLAVRAGGYHSVQPLYGTVGGISLAGDADRPVIAAYAVYLGVIALFFGLAAAAGRRAGCHSVCWMAPFMIAGRSLRNLGRWPALQLAADSRGCESCGNCTSECPMGLDVQSMVAAPTMEDPECVLCGTCADTCPNGVISYSFGKPGALPRSAAGRRDS
jgi:polyferredoxin